MTVRKALICLFLLCVSAFSLPARAAPPLSVYGQLPGFEMAALSSSGDHVAMIGVVGEDRLLIVMDKDAKVVLHAPVGKAKVRDLSWAGDEYVLLRVSNTTKLGPDFVGDKIELYSMIVMPLATRTPWSVFARNEMMTGGVRGFHGVRQKNGKWFGYFGGLALEGPNRDTAYLQSGRPALFEVDLATQRAVKIAPRPDDFYRTWLIGVDGKVSATFDLMQKSGDWSIRNAAGQKIASGTDKLGNVDVVGFGQTADSVIYSVPDADRNNDDHWFEIALSGGAPKEVLAGVAIHRTLFDQRSQQLIGYEQEGDTPAYTFVSPYHQKVANALQKAFPGLAMHIEDWNDRFDRLIVMTEGPADPQTWWLVDIKTGDAKQIGVSYPMRSADVGPMKMVTYKAQDGTDIPAVLTLPPGRAPKNLPVVIFPHGGPMSRDYPGFDWWAQAFAARGYAVLQPNFRGSSGYGNAFQRAGYGQWGKAMQTDLSDGLAWMAAQGIADPKRACIMGASYGGYAALAGVTLQNGLYRCSVAVAGVSDMAKAVSNRLTNSGSDPMMRRWYEDAWGSGKDLRAVSPIHFVSRADAPILLVHGKDDTVVEYGQSHDMASALKAAGKPVEFVTLAGEDHWLSRSDTRLAMLEAAVAFIEKHNPPDPAK